MPPLTADQRCRVREAIAEDAEIYCSYLAHKYVPSATKRMILSQLGKRAQSHLDATIITESVMGLVPELLESPDIHIQRLTYWVLGILAYQDRTGKAVSTYTRATSSLRLNEYLQVSDQEAEIIMKTILALRRLAGTAVDGEVEEVLKGAYVTASESPLGPSRSRRYCQGAQDLSCLLSRSRHGRATGGISADSVIPP
ncbi:hypothetical protein C8R45DRAFT_928789 [Mycena sanguinolenta]|nr:hypothetical protein C8R45DRAFT_928789 [Mycena sanguinolenta]